MEILRGTGEDLTEENLTKEKKCGIIRGDSDTFQITNIKQAVRNENRVNVFLDGEYDFSLDIAQLVDFKLKVGQKLTAAEVKKYRKASEFGKVYQRTLEWVLMRPRSVRETRDYLRRKSLKRRVRDDAEKKAVVHLEMELLPDEMIDEIIERLLAKKFLDDRKFAEFYVENRFVKKGVSRRRLEQELLKKGVDRLIIEQVLAKTERTEVDEIKKMIAKKRNKYDDEKLIQYLVRQGFDYQMAKNLVLDEKD